MEYSKRDGYLEMIKFSEAFDNYTFRDKMNLCNKKSAIKKMSNG